MIFPFKTEKWQKITSIIIMMVGVFLTLSLALYRIHYYGFVVFMFGVFLFLEVQLENNSKKQGGKKCQ